MSPQFQHQLKRLDQAIERLKDHLEAQKSETHQVASEKEALVKENWNLRRERATHGSEIEGVEQLTHVINTLHTREDVTRKTIKTLRSELTQIRQNLMQ